MNKPFILGIAGGTGSGKTTIAKKIKDHFADRSCYIPHDRYYRDQSSKSIEERRKTNYDHPDSLETHLFVEHLQKLQNGEAVEIPQYDFTQHTRKSGETEKVDPAALIIIDGILIFHDPSLRNLIDFKIFVDVSSDIRILRRTIRDIQERGRTLEFCVDQYLTFTRPMHNLFVEPTKEYADVIIPRGGFNEEGIRSIVDTIKERLE